MLSRIVLNGAPSFASTGCALDDLGRFNFIFGPNGTGKTTISRVVADPTLHPGTACERQPNAQTTAAHVYNRDYADQTLQEASRLTGVFVLDDEDPEARKEFTELTRPDGTISSHQDSVKDITGKLGALQKQVQTARSVLIDSAWAKRANVPAELKPMFDGFNSSRETFAVKLIGVKKASTPDLGDLLRESRGAFDQGGAQASPISAMPSYDGVTSAPGLELLGVPVAGSSDVTLAALIEQMDNQDWVSEGRDFLATSAGLCPFCQQDLPSDFLRHLAEFYDDDYTQKVGLISSLSKATMTVHSSLRLSLDQLDSLDDSFVDVGARDKASLNLRAALTTNEVAIAAKVSNPSSRVEVSDLAPLLSQANKVIRETNALISEHNARLANRTRARIALVARCWTYFAWEVMAADLGRYLGVSAGTETRRAELEAKLAESTAALAIAQLRATELENALVSSAPAIERINRLLGSVGFRRFQLAPSDEIKDGYRLQRLDGTAAANTLSDGERSFIAFLYYFVQLEGRHLSADAGTLVAVIDDPISSLDSDVLFVVGSLVRRVIQMINSNTGRLKQLIVLTHNVQFYIELTYPRAKDKKSGAIAWRRYYELQRGVDGDTVVVASDRNDVRSNYQRLWQVARDASKDSGPSDAGLENILRRILENYFTVIGNYPDLDELMEASSGDEAIASKALLAWLHHGSHTLVDDFDYSPSGISKSVYLAVFREIFDRTGQIGHYELMMSID